MTASKQNTTKTRETWPADSPMILEEEMVVARLLRGTVLPGRSLFGRAGFARKCGEIDVLSRSHLRLRGTSRKQTVGITCEDRRF
jgi:hypothetical protein